MPSAVRSEPGGGPQIPQMNADKWQQVPGENGLAHLDGMRAVAALYVVVHHSLLQVGYTETHLHGPMQKIAAIFGYGHYAVDLFIVLSGFCLAIPMARGNFSGAVSAPVFFFKRARRILPPYYAACAFSLLLSWLFIGPGPASQWSKTWVAKPWDIYSHLILVQDVFVNVSNKVNYVLWSISVEWRIYFLFPLLILAWRRFGGAGTTLLAGTASLGLGLGLYRLRDRFPELNLEPCGVCPHFLLLFVLGILAAEIALSETALSKRCRALPWTALTLLAAASIPLAPKLRVLTGRPVPWEVNDLCVGMAAVCMLVVCAMPQGASRLGWLRSIFCWRPLVIAGAGAYSIYLVHAPVLELIWRYGLRKLPLGIPAMAVAITAVGMPVVLAVSYVFFRCFERPFLPRRRSDCGTPASRDAAVPA